jgi:hypothetical protein
MEKATETTLLIDTDASNDTSIQLPKLNKKLHNYFYGNNSNNKYCDYLICIVLFFCIIVTLIIIIKK